MIIDHKKQFASHFLSKKSLFSLSRISFSIVIHNAEGHNKFIANSVDS